MNPFSKDYKPQIKLVATPRETQLYAQTKAKREELVMTDNIKKTLIIGSRAAADKSNRIKHVCI